MFCHRYGWGADDVLDLTETQFNGLADAIRFATDPNGSARDFKADSESDLRSWAKRMSGGRR